MQDHVIMQAWYAKTSADGLQSYTVMTNHWMTNCFQYSYATEWLPADDKEYGVRSSLNAKWYGVRNVQEQNLNSRSSINIWFEILPPLRSMTKTNRTS